MNRRTFIKYGGGGLTSLAFGHGLFKLAALETVMPPTKEFTLFIEGVQAEMVDHTWVHQWAFRPQAGLSPEVPRKEPWYPAVPGPLLEVVQGDEVRITITNNLDELHAFQIPGMKRVISEYPLQLADVPLEVPPDKKSVTAVYKADAAGTYIYLDPLNAPVNRVLGLHGALVVCPASADKPTPYNPASETRQAFETSPAVRKLFDDLGAWNTRFNFIGCEGGTPKRGEYWRTDRYKVWLFNQIHPRFNRMAAPAGAPPIDPELMKKEFLPRYFTLNGRSGFPAAHDKGTAPHGRLGQPILIRCLNAGICTHSPHIHGNHVYELAARDAAGALRVSTNIFERDSWTMKPCCAADVLLPYEVPPDIWPWPPKNLLQFTQQLPLLYAMHCHTEMSQTAAGGMYPHGAITHWEIDEA